MRGEGEKRKEGRKKRAREGDDTSNSSWRMAQTILATFSSSLQSRNSSLEGGREG